MRTRKYRERLKFRTILKQVQCGEEDNGRRTPVTHLDVEDNNPNPVV